ncbi:MAG: hypothetical protein RIS48_2389 [Pseudomonadota bacterium]|jgi:uncharacterized protein (DUF4415 family)|uniref:BrnA antitoxin family protein n=1 Tax=Malikia spinosa TaxID=86180 RepID=UPI0032341F9B
MDIKRIDIDKVAKAIEADAGEALPDLRQSLAEAKAGLHARVHTPEQIAARRGRPTKTTHKQPVTLRLDPEALAAWRASGKGWQTRAAQVLADWLKTHSPA